MTSRPHVVAPGHFALRRQSRQQARLAPDDDQDAARDGTMEDENASVKASSALSDYGSDVDFDLLLAQSEYGSEIDPADIAPLSEGISHITTLPVAAAVVAYQATGVTQDHATHPDAEVTVKPSPEPEERDDRAPLERFRSKPRNPLSVTDLVSPAWCELQYFYTLSKFGRKPRTQAMQRGSVIHEKLEREVHTFVPVQAKSKEDKFGLKIWNAIQGLRCLRETGLTRELQVWGVIEGQVVNGIIDELSYACPDEELEEKVELAKAQKSGGTLPLGQSSIEQAFQKAVETSRQSAEDNADGWLGALKPDRSVYISDTKTRGMHSLPTGASLRPTWMQLMLYRKLLESLALNTVDAETIFARYNLAPLETFTEKFMLDAGALGSDEMPLDDDDRIGDPLSSNELHSHPNLLSLWSLMISELQMAVPVVSDILRAEFRHSKSGAVIGSKLLVYSAEDIDKYVKEEMDWWKGGRQARGVDIEEAYKCRICDFADVCTWRITKIEEATEKHRLRRSTRRVSAV